MKSIKFMSTMGSILIFGAAFLAGQAMAHLGEHRKPNDHTPQNKQVDERLHTIMHILENETFTLNGVNDGSQPIIQDCVFESESAVWTIDYCEDVQHILPEGDWYSLLAGTVSIKNTDWEMVYHLKLNWGRHIYAEFAKYHPHYVFAGVSSHRLRFTGDNFTESVDVSHNLPFIQDLARVQWEHIKKSVKE